MKIFSFINSKDGKFSRLTPEEFNALVSSGRLVKTFLIDTRFGGRNSSDNAIYVAKEAADAKKQVDDELERRLIYGGNVQNYRCRLSYRGKSRIPASLIVQAVIDDQQFRKSIKIW